MYYRLIIALLALFVIVAYIDTKNLQQHFDDAKILREYNKTSSLLGIGIKESDGKLKIKDVIMNTPAQKVGLEVGDILLDIDGKKVSSAYMIRDYLNYVKNKRISLTIQKPNNRIVKVFVVPTSINNFE